MTDAELGALMMTEARLNRAMNAAGDPDDDRPEMRVTRDEWLQARIRRHAAVMARLLTESTNAAVQERLDADGDS